MKTFSVPAQPCGRGGRRIRLQMELMSILFLACSAGAQAQACIDPSVPASIEERRLTAKLTTGNANTFAADLLAATGFAHFEADFVAALCGATPPASYDDALLLVKSRGQALWRAAVGRAQGRSVTGTLPRSDERMLYWSRLTLTRALRQWRPAFALSAPQRDELLWQLERSSRGHYDISFPAGPAYKRLLISGIDPAGLPAAGSNGTGLRTGSGAAAIALSLDGSRVRLPDGSTAVIEAYLLPSSYAPFMAGMQEDTIAPWFVSGPQRADASLTLGQGSGDQFWIEQWNGRFHGTVAGNDAAVTCPTGNTRLPATGECDIYPPPRWLGYESKPWQQDAPPQFTSTSLPIAELIADRTGAGVPRPPSDTAVQPDAFDVIWHPSYTANPDCTSIAFAVANSPVPTTPFPFTFPYPVIEPPATACARLGGSGDQAANESAYRNTLLRDVLAPGIAAGHISTPVMSRFQSDNTVITDPMFEAYRDAVVQQGRNLALSLARNVNAPRTPLMLRAAPSDVFIWPNRVGPGSEGLTFTEVLAERSTDPTANDRATTRITMPKMTVHVPANPNGVAILVAPGGGYDHVTIDKEGTDVALAFNPFGITVFVLDYRLPGEGHANRENVPLEDAQRAIRLIRANAAQWNLDPSKIGVMGFSAGGHVAASVGTLYDKPVYTPVDASDSVSARPDFMVLLYPVITMDLTFGHAGSRIQLLGNNPTPAQLAQWSVENWVNARTPPTFVALAANDTTVNPAHNGILFEQAVAAVQVPAELHVFPLSGHGFGIRSGIGDAKTWPQLALDWLHAIGVD